MRNSIRNHLQYWGFVHSVLGLVMLPAIAVMVFMLLARPALTSAPTVAEIAQAVNGPTQFQRPSAMKFVPETNTCVVGGTVVSGEWSVGNKVVAVGAENDPYAVDYTTFKFRSDTGRVFDVTADGGLFVEPGESLGLQVSCDPATMYAADSFSMVEINHGGK